MQLEQKIQSEEQKSVPQELRRHQLEREAVDAEMKYRQKAFHGQLTRQQARKSKAEEDHQVGIAPEGIALRKRFNGLRLSGREARLVLHYPIFPNAWHLTPDICIILD